MTNVLEELKRLYEAGTKGAWHAWQPAKTCLREREWTVSRFDPEYSHRDMEAIVCSLNSDGSNARLIACMHEHLPALLRIAEAAKELQYQGAISGPFYKEPALEAAFASMDEALASLTTQPPEVSHEQR